MATTTVLRSLHDLGLASWFGGSLMGITGLRVAASSGTDSLTAQTDRAADGWDAWSPVVLASVATHTVGGIGLIVVNSDRHRRQDGVLPLTVATALVTGAALATTLGQGVLGRRLRQAQRDADGGDVTAKEQAERLRRQVRTLDVATPVLTGTLVVLAAREGELQRTGAVDAGAAARLAGRARTAFRNARESVVDELPDREAVTDRLSDLATTVRVRLEDAGLDDAVEQLREGAVERLENLSDLKDAVLDRAGLAAA